MEAAPPIILASASPRRRRLFEQIGIPFEVIPPDVDEAIAPGSDPVAVARDAAQRKGCAVADRLEGARRSRWVVAADTVVVVDGEILGKPADDAEARRMLGSLSGRTHRVVTGWAVGGCDRPWTVGHEETRVTFFALSDREMDRYVATGEGRDKAGAYGIQRFGALLVERIEGDYFNVVGLPIARVVRALLDAGALPGFSLS